MASTNITFSNIPASIRKPGKYFEYNTRMAVNTLPANAQKMLIVGQRLTGGSVPALTPTQVYSSAQAADYFGAGSMLHRMVLAAITANAYLDLTVCALDDGAGAAATDTVTIAGTATGAGVLTLSVGNQSCQIAIAATDAAAAKATALQAALAQISSLPVAATVNAAVVTLTSKNKGLVGNQIDIAVSCTAPGLTATLANPTLTGGTIDPDISTALTKVFAQQYTIICTPYNDQTSLTALRTHLDSVSGPMEQRPGIAAFGFDGALAAATTLAGQINGGRLSMYYLRGTTTPAYEMAAAYGAVIASEEDPAMPLNTLALTGIAAPPISQRLSRTEQETCLYNGVTPGEVGPGEVVQIVRAISTYTLDPQGIADISLLDITTIRTLDYVRLACRTRIALRFPRSKLSSKTPSRVWTELYDVLLKLDELEIIENVAANKDGLLVERDLQDPNRLDAKIPDDVVNGLHVFAGRIDLIL